MKFKLLLFAYLFVLLGNKSGEATKVLSKRALAGDHQFPWHASIMSCTRQACQFCGGSLISTRHVLTAAHCTKQSSQFEISLGSNYYFQPTLKVKANQKIQHPDHDPSVWGNDIAIIILPNDVPLSRNIQTIELASDKSGDLEKISAELTGFGRTNISK